jgi:hypothetical protein
MTMGKNHEKVGGRTGKHETERREKWGEKMEIRKLFGEKCEAYNI